MKVFQYIQLAFENLLVNKLRSFLTMLGIIIGVANIILVVAVLFGAKTMILKEIGSLGSNIIYVTSQEGYIPKECIFTIERIPDVARVAPGIYISSRLKIGENIEDITLYGSSHNLNILLNIQITKGRFFLESDERLKKKVCVIDERLAEMLFKGSSPIGEELVVEGEIFRVIGVAKEKSILSKLGSYGTIYIPFSIAKRMQSIEKITNLTIFVKDIEKIEELTENIKKILSKKSGSFSVYHMQEFVDKTRIVASIIVFIITLIAGISLVVGGIGIMNIMLVQVRERTREIGIRKAFGASNQDILIQFLIESCILSLSGGVIGIVVGILVANIIAFFLELSFLINIWYIFWGFLVACLVGIFFGIYPAKIASKLNPIDVLRYE